MSVTNLRSGMCKSLAIQMVGSIPHDLLDEERMKSVVTSGEFSKKLAVFWDFFICRVITVVRTVQAKYPSWTKEILDPKLENTGPAEINLGELELWLHDSQKGGGWINGEKLYDYLKQTGIINDCLSLRDGEAIIANQQLIPANWNHQVIFLWKSVIKYQHSDGGLYVPYLVQGGTKWMVDWRCLGQDWFSNNPTLRFRQ